MLSGFHFHHIGYAVFSIERTASLYIPAGWICSETIFDPLQKVRIAFLERSNTPLIELVEAVDEQSPVIQIIKKSGVSPYHVCYEVSDIEFAIREMRKKRFLPLFTPVPAVAFNNCRICYLYHNDVGLIELLEQ